MSGRRCAWREWPDSKDGLRTGMAVSVKSTRKGEGVSAWNRRRNAGHGHELTRSVELPVLRGPLLAREHDHARLDRRPSRLGRGKSGSTFGAASDLAKCGSSSLVEGRRQVARHVLLRQNLVLVLRRTQEGCGVRVARKERQCRGLGVATHQTRSSRLRRCATPAGSPELRCANGCVSIFRWRGLGGLNQAERTLIGPREVLVAGTHVAAEALRHGCCVCV